MASFIPRPSPTVSCQITVLVLSELTLRMPATTVEEIYYRKIKAMDIESFQDVLRESKLY